MQEKLGESNSLEVPGVYRAAKNSLLLPPESSASTMAVVLGACVLAHAAGMDVPVLLLASNFRQLGFPQFLF